VSIIRRLMNQKSHANKYNVFQSLITTAKNIKS
jgi:hypothetical protein